MPQWRLGSTSGFDEAEFSFPMLEHFSALTLPGQPGSNLAAFSFEDKSRANVATVRGDNHVAPLFTRKRFTATFATESREVLSISKNLLSSCN